MATEIITKTLYGGDVLIDFYPKSHQYKLDGKRLQSVTSALGVIGKPQLIYWSANMAADFLIECINDGRTITTIEIEEARRKHTEKKNDAAATGKLVHEWVENYVKTGASELPENEQVLNGVLAFLKWVKEHDVKFLSAERMVYSKSHKYVGTMDAEAYVDGKLCVVDYKTGKKIYPEARFQTSAYQKAAEEELEESGVGQAYTGDRWIVRFDKETGEFEAEQFGDLEEDFITFISAMTIKARLKQLS